MSRPPNVRQSGHGSHLRINGRIRVREVRVIGPEGQQVGIMPTSEALQMARNHQLDLVEVAPAANPPVCRIVDYGKYRYEQSKKERDSKKSHHTHKVKEIQFRPLIDPHDFGIKVSHAIEFLCDEMKVKVSLRFRGRELAHKELGFEVVNKFIKTIAAWGTPDAPVKSLGKAIHVMVSPLPRNKRAANPNPRIHPLEPTSNQSSDSDDDSDSSSDEKGEFSNAPFKDL